MRSPKVEGNAYKILCHLVQGIEIRRCSLPAAPGTERRDAVMANSQFDLFLNEATYSDHASGFTLDRDRLYGLYTSWCMINQQRLGSESTFWSAMKHRINPGHNGLRMKGPAAADYILASYPGLV